MSHVVLTGLSGVGKSTIGAAYAAQVGRRFIDLDAEIEARSSRSVADWFSVAGEAAFRAYELDVLKSLHEEQDAVVALGGGAMTSEAGQQAALSLGHVLWLSARPSTVLQRLNDSHARPLLAQDPAKRLRQQLRERSASYAHAHHVVDADGDVEQVVANVADALVNVRRTVSVRSHKGAYPVRLGVYTDQAFATALTAFFNQSIMVLVVDAAVKKRGEAIAAAMSAQGVRVAVCVVQAGERLKRLDAIEALATWFAEVGVDRHSVVVAIGGGSVTDAVGFAASTYMRGVPWVSAPSTMLGLVDSGLGGKVGANLGKGKNLLGAFYPPICVLADLSFLGSLPKTEVRAGMAEMLKVAATHDADYFAALEKMGEGQLLPEALLDRIARAASIKAAVVSEDEFEHGVRKVLNFGHTFGHAFESAAGLSQLRHGEAVALGMLAETEFFVGREVAEAVTLQRLQKAVRALGLPAEWRAYAKAGAGYVAKDKKRIDDHIAVPIVPRIGSFRFGTATVADMVNFLETEGARS